MRTALYVAATAAALTLGVVAAEAAPVVVLGPAVAPPIVLVAGGCGLGFHRGPYGGCLRNGGYVARRVFPLYRGICVPRRTAFGWRRVCR